MCQCCCCLLKSEACSAFARIRKICMKHSQLAVQSFASMRRIRKICTEHLQVCAAFATHLQNLYETFASTRGIRTSPMPLELKRYRPIELVCCQFGYSLSIVHSLTPNTEHNRTVCNIDICTQETAIISFV